jgi:hypothetical protein
VSEEQLEYIINIYMKYEKKSAEKIRVPQNFFRDKTDQKAK